MIKLHLVTLVSAPPIRAVKPPTVGPWSDLKLAETARKHEFPPTSPRSPSMYVVDLSDVDPTIEVLETYILPLAQDIKLGKHGQTGLVISTKSEAVKRYIAFLSARYDVPMYLAGSPDPVAIPQSKPAGPLTPTEQETLDSIAAMGGRVGAVQVANRLGLQGTAASNRLAALASKGYLYRVSRPGREGDLFVDPRFPSLEQSVESVLAAARNSLSPEEFERTERLLRRTLENGHEATATPDAY